MANIWPICNHSAVKNKQEYYVDEESLQNTMKDINSKYLANL